MADQEPYLAGLFPAPENPQVVEFVNEINDMRDFTITGRHLQLLARLNVGWLDGTWGGPAVSTLRPYGDSDAFGNIAEMVDRDAWEDARECDEATWDAYVALRDAEFMRLHAETMIVLRIVLQTGQYRSGRFRRGNQLGAPWRPAVSVADSRHFGICYHCEQRIGSGRLAGLTPVEGPDGADGPVWCGQSTCPPS